MFTLIFAVLAAITYLVYDFLSTRPDLATPFVLRWLLVGVFASLSVVIVRGISYLLIDVTFTRLSNKRPSELLRLVVSVMLYGVATSLVMRFVLQADVAAIVTSTALVTAVIGFGLQSTLGNVFEGLSVQIHQPFHIGDRVEIPPYYGVVESLTWRAVMVRQEDNTLVTIPNNMLANGAIRVFPVEEPVRVSVQFPAPVDVPPRRVINLVSAAVSTSREIMQSRYPEVLAVDITADESAMQYEVRFYTFPEREIDRVSAHVRERVWYALARAGIAMPAAIEGAVDAFKVPLLRDSRTQHVNQRDDLVVLSSVALFESVPLAVVREVLAGTVRLIFAPGEEILVTGPSRFSLFIVARGMVSVPLPVGTEEVEENTMFVENYWQPEQLEAVREQFSEFMGPLSGYLVRNASRFTSDPYHLYRRLAEDIPTDHEREAFLALGPESPAREIEPGQFFGERGLFLGEPFEATGVTAVSEVEILEVTTDLMRHVLHENPEINPRLATNISAYLQRKRRIAMSPSVVQGKMQEMLG
jgi:small-conductance mechanosensitive channel/CRP-like cAMP-binding protein